MIFLRYDIRGKYPKELNEKVMEQIGIAVGVKWKRVVVSRDLRPSGESLQNALISGLTQNGVDVLVAPPSHFGLAWFNAFKAGRECLYITASHLPYNFNGLKFYHPDGTGFSVEELQEVYEWFERAKPRKRGKVWNIDRSEEYMDFVLENFKSDKKVVVDFGGGATTLYVPKVWRKICEHVGFLHERPDPYLKVRNPEPVPEALGKLKGAMKGKDLGVAYDGDGDRVVFLDDEGKFLSPEEVAVYLAREMHAPRIVANIDCSMLLEEALPDAEVYRVPVGHPYVTRACREKRADMGVESSGHFIITKYSYFDDGVLVSFALASELDVSLSSFRKKLPKYYKKRFKFKVRDRKKTMEKLKKRLEKEYELNLMDGIKVEFEDAWVLIRPSNTEPVIRLTIEAKSKKRFEQLKKEFLKLLK
ncbi:hypothetical protein DRN62_03685 [Nanoarchaeota archaeon]|nr:MAG: hypothetical protein DRN62_03685 [Nanoarchaeota archaeon]